MSEKTYYVGVDGGGTKLLSILFDEDLNFISKGTGGSINPNFASLDAVRQSMEESINMLLPEGFDNQIACCYTTMPGPADLYVSILSNRCKVLSHVGISEGAACLLSGSLEKDGIVALSGTGSGAYHVENTVALSHLGGWGALIGDEGSGFDIGRKGMLAAIHSYDGRGPKTILEEAVRKHFNAKDFLDVRIKVYKSPYFRTSIAALCLLVLRAAEQGDDVAKAIMGEAGEDMAVQVLTLIREGQLNPDLCKVVVSGSVWRNNPIMYESFSNAVYNRHPQVVIQKPLFEPVIGSVVKTAYLKHNEINGSVKAKLLREFNAFKYEK